MNKIELKRLALLILEILIIEDIHYINENFAIWFNEFIYKYYKKNKELFSIIYNPQMLEKFMANNYEILSIDQMTQLLDYYHGFEGYIYLLDEVGYDIEQKLNKLAQLFDEYYKSIIDLYESETIVFPKGYPRILQ